MRLLLPLLLAALVAPAPPSSSARAPGATRLAVAWNEPARGAAAAMRTAAPWRFVGARREVGADSVLRTAGGRLYAVSRAAGTVTVLRLRGLKPLAVFDLGAGSEPQDIAVVSPELAYVTRAGAGRLLRLDPRTGASSEAVDLSGFADSDGVPDLGTMAVHEGRLFVQVRRLNADGPFGYEPPGYVAVVDLATERLVDVDPEAPGVQAIALEGTSPKLRMQVVAETRRLFVSATGGFFDDGGIEAVDLDRLRSLGLVVRERDGEVGADLGAFVMVAPDRGFLVYSTDLDLSSHLKPFTLDGGVPPGPELDVSVGYFVPALGHDPRRDLLFVPTAGFARNGVNVFDATSGERLTPAPVATDGPPTDVLVVPRR